MNDCIKEIVISCLEKTIDKKISNNSNFENMDLFDDLGMDSIEVIELIVSISDRLQIDVFEDVDLIKNILTVREITEYLHKRVGEKEDING